MHPPRRQHLLVPYISRWYRRPNEGVIEHGNVAGFGDVSVLATVRAYSYVDPDKGLRISIQAGLKMPTGDDTQLKSERDGGGDEDPDNAVGGHDLMLGTGSWDPLVGANAIGRLDRVYASAQAFYTIHTQGAYQYQVANELTATGCLGYYVIMRASDRVGVQLDVIGETKGLDTVDGEKTDDTANHDLFVGPEVNVEWHRQLTALAALDIPVIERNSETQLVPTWRVRAAVGWRF